MTGLAFTPWKRVWRPCALGHAACQSGWHQQGPPGPKQLQPAAGCAIAGGLDPCGSTRARTRCSPCAAEIWPTTGMTVAKKMADCGRFAWWPPAAQANRTPRGARILGKKTKFRRRQKRARRRCEPLCVWWRRGGSNSRPSHCERDALPAELRPHERLQFIKTGALGRPCG